MTNYYPTFYYNDPRYVTCNGTYCNSISLMFNVNQIYPSSFSFYIKVIGMGRTTDFCVIGKKRISPGILLPAENRIQLEMKRTPRVVKIRNISEKFEDMMKLIRSTLILPSPIEVIISSEGFPMFI